MNGLEKILGIIDADTKQNEAAIIGAAEKKAAAIIESGNRSGQQAYEKEFGKLKASAELEYRTACSSAEDPSHRNRCTRQIHISFCSPEIRKAPRSRRFRAQKLRGTT